MKSFQAAAAAGTAGWGARHSAPLPLTPSPVCSLPQTPTPPGLAPVPSPVIGGGAALSALGETRPQEDLHLLLLFYLLTSWRVHRQMSCVFVNFVNLIFVVVSPLILLQFFRYTVVLSLSNRVFTHLFQFLTYFEIIYSSLFYFTVGQIETQASLVAQQ